jgi:hypothetical protein
MLKKQMLNIPNLGNENSWRRLEKVVGQKYLATAQLELRTTTLQYRNKIAC